MASSRAVKVLAVKDKYQQLFTTGKICITSEADDDGTCYMFCNCEDRVQVINLSTGRIHQVFHAEEEDAIQCMCLSPDDKHLYMAMQSRCVRQWNWREARSEKAWQTLQGPVAVMCMDVSSTLLCTGSSDASLRIWDVDQKGCTHMFMGHSGVISVAEINLEIGQKGVLVSAAQDKTLCVWNLNRKKRCLSSDAHKGVVTSICFSEDNKTMYSSGMDQVVMVWNTQDWSCTAMAVYEPVECMALLPPARGKKRSKPNCPHLVTSSGHSLKVWAVEAREEVSQLECPVGAKDSTITQLFFAPALAAFVVVTSEGNILFYSRKSFALTKQMVGDLGDVLELQFLGGKQRHLVAATNSALLPVFELETWQCRLLPGHTDIVLAIAVSACGTLLTSAGKDRMIRVWRFDEDTGQATCVACTLGHAGDINTLAFSRRTSEFLVSGSMDETAKVWDLSALPEEEVESPVELQCVCAERCHQKEISCVAVAPNDKLLATCSMDRTAKVWNTRLSLMGKMEHKRAVHCIIFSPTDKVVATSTGGGKIRLWNLDDFSCLKTLEGHDPHSTVAKICFVSAGTQILSSATDGLMKLWNVDKGEMVKTLDQHEGKVWALAVNSPDKAEGRELLAASGGDDSSIIIWKDETEEEKQRNILERNELMQKELKLQNLMHQKRHLEAFSEALLMELPHNTLTALKALTESEEGIKAVEKVIAKLPLERLGTLIKYAASWNTTARHSTEARIVLHAVFNSFLPEELLTLPDIGNTIQSIILYTERHNDRIRRRQQDNMFLTYQRMKTSMTSGEKAPALLNGSSKTDVEP